jgi:hypothetical protein
MAGNNSVTAIEDETLQSLGVGEREAIAMLPEHSRSFEKLKRTNFRYRQEILDQHQAQQSHPFSHTS